MCGSTHRRHVCGYALLGLLVRLGAFEGEPEAKFSHTVWTSATTGLKHPADSRPRTVTSRWPDSTPAAITHGETAKDIKETPRDIKEMPRDIEETLIQCSCERGKFARVQFDESSEGRLAEASGS